MNTYWLIGFFLFFFVGAAGSFVSLFVFRKFSGLVCVLALQVFSLLYGPALMAAYYPHTYTYWGIVTEHTYRAWGIPNLNLHVPDDIKDQLR